MTLEIILAISLSKSGYLVLRGDKETLLIADLKLELVLFELFLLFDVVLLALFASFLSSSLFSSSTTWTTKLAVPVFCALSVRV